MIDGKTRSSFVGVSLSLPKQLPIDPFVKVQHFLANLEQFLSKEGILSDKVVHLPLISFQQKYVLCFILLTGLLLGWGEALKDLE